MAAVTSFAQPDAVIVLSQIIGSCISINNQERTLARYMEHLKKPIGASSADTQAIADGHDDDTGSAPVPIADDLDDLLDVEVPDLLEVEVPEVSREDDPNASDCAPDPTLTGGPKAISPAHVFKTDESDDVFSGSICALT